ncbi:TrbI/VirB10 family protein [Sphingomonas sp.]|uniref:TrbI/VirB10 family protein n=1 Tax=Sphingomonas sp. TaxID=28214 RepID=UPI0031E19AAA
MWVFVAAAGIAAVILFAILETRRQSLSTPAVTARSADAGTFAPPPALVIPPAYTPPPLPAPQPVRAVPATLPPPPTAPVRAAPPPEPQIVYAPAPQPQPAPPPEPAREYSSTMLVIDQGAQTRREAADRNEGSDGPAARGQAALARDTSRARAGALANRSTTIVQGTLIQAVLESGLDSTRAGFARAIVSRDVRGFDNSRVLIPRGSRLIGEYGAENSAGQKRALVNWTRLIRPDGVTIAIGSPVADTVGRTGVRARVNSHFFERFGGAILQSILDIGVNIASKEAGAPTIYAFPGSSVTGQAIQPQQITPTLTVKPGTSVSVFVARDLDFTGAGTTR